MKIKWQEDEWVQRRIETAVGKVQTPDEVGEVADGAVVGNGRRFVPSPSWSVAEKLVSLFW